MSGCRRPALPFLAALLLGFAALAGTALHARGAQERAAERWAAQERLVARLGLTDLCLVTDARYTRHPAMADLHAPFQDHPTALEHFPSGALLAPPPHLVDRGRAE